MKRYQGQNLNTNYVTVFSILFGHIVELCSNVSSNYVRLFSIMFGGLD